MKNIKIIHLFPKLLSLYGEYGNVAVLEDVLKKNGHNVEKFEYESGDDIDFDAADIVYVGSGTEDNLMEANRRLQPVKEIVSDAIRNGGLWIATGNAMTLFGSSVERRGEAVGALEVFDYRTKIDDERRYSGDVITDRENCSDHVLVGYINTSSVYSGINDGFSMLKLNENLGNDKSSSTDGIQIENFIGTQLIGPILAKNPYMLAYIYKKIVGDELNMSDSDYIVRAYNTAVDELGKRI